MKITKKLALQQVKNNPRRSLGAIFSVIMSSAMLTAIFSFVTSAKRMVTDFLGEDLGEYGGAYLSMMIIPILVLTGIVIYMAFTIISNIFRSSATERMKEFGTLKCVGATRSQIRTTILWEAVFISIVGIPIGIALGVLIGFISVLVTSHFVENMNDLAQSVILHPVSLSLSFHTNVLTILFSILFSILTVYFSALRPARKAARITPAECIRGLGEMQLGLDKRVGKKFVKWGNVEKGLAERNIARNPYAYKPTIRSLRLGIMLTVLTAGMLSQVRGIGEMLDVGMDCILVDYCSNYDYEEGSLFEKETYTRPISLQDTERVTAAFADFLGEVPLGIGADNGTYHAYVLGEDAPAELYVLDSAHYEAICEEKGVANGSIFLINTFVYNDNGKMKQITPFGDSCEEITLYTADGEERSMVVTALLYPGEYPEVLDAGLNRAPVKLIVPDAPVRFFDWYVEAENEPAFMDFARGVVDEVFPTYSEDPYYYEGFAVRISRADVMMRVYNIAIVIGEFIMIGFIVLLMVVGFVNVISSLSTNLKLRAGEFAAYHSIGMTTRSIRKELFWESVLCVSRASILGVLIGSGVPWILNLFLRRIFPVSYHFPFAAAALSVVGVLGVVLLINEGRGRFSAFIF